MPWITSQNSSDKKFNSILRIIKSFGNNSTSHGLPKIARSRTSLMCVFWIIVSLLTTSLFVWQSFGLLNKYKTYPKSARLEVANEPILFPAISLCNLRPLDIYTYGDVIYNSKEEFRWKIGEDYNYQGRNDSKVPVFEKRLIDYANRYLSYHKYSQIYSVKNADEDFLWSAERLLFNRMTLAANMNISATIQGGIRKEEFIARCEYQGRKCSSDDFNWFLDPAFFNCYTLNVTNLGGNTVMEGPDNGLSVVLFAPTISIMNYSDEGAARLALYNELTLGGEGIRLVIHPVNTVPYPLTEGLDIPRGVAVNIGIGVQKNYRLGPPHGNCTRKIMLGNSNYSYTMASCKKECLQKNVIKACNCADVSLPLTNDLFDDASSDLKFCAAFDEVNVECRGEVNITKNYELCKHAFEKWFDRVDCMKKTRSNISRNLSAWTDCKCLPPCTDSDYGVFHSLSDWPMMETSKFLLDDLFFTNGFLKKFHTDKRHKYFHRFITDKQINYANYKKFILDKNLMRLNVYISETSVVKIEETDDYNFLQLISDLGGQMGLWIGVSAITLMESIELIYTFTLYFIGKKRKTVFKNKISVVSINQNTEFSNI